MASSTASRRSALAGLALGGRNGAVELSEAAVACRFVYRGAPDVLGNALRFPLPTRPLSAVSVGGRAALWLGPDEWLLIAVSTELKEMLDDLRTTLSTAPACLVDVGNRNVGLIISGPRAADLLACGCPLDLGLAAFPVDMCTRTIFGKCEVVVWRLADQKFHLEAWRSFAPYLVCLLGEAANSLPQATTFCR